MKRICLGTMITLLYQSRIRSADKIKTVCGGIFAAFGLDIDNFNQGLPSHLKSGHDPAPGFWYFDHDKVMPLLSDLLKPKGKLVILYMAWLPFEDAIAGASEEIVLKYSPKWSGAGETRKPIWIPDVVYRYFELEDHEEYDVMIPFTRESWHGRMKACRGVGASLSSEELHSWEKEHLRMLEEKAPETFEVLHYAALTVLKKKGDERYGV